MKKPLYYILGILILASLYFVFIHKSNIMEDLNFNVEDTSRITKIVVSDKNKSVVISKVSGQWMVNDSYHANQALVKQLLRVFKNLEISVLIPNNQTDTFSNTIKKNGVKLEFYNQQDLIQYQFIGNYDESVKSTPILNEADKAAYITSPGLSANIRKFVEVDDIFWRDKLIFSQDSRQISDVSLTDLKHPEKSFTISAKNKSYQLFDGTGKSVAFNKENIERYLSYFTNVSFESLEEKFSKAQADSLLKQEPIYAFQVNTIQGQKVRLNLFQKYSDKNPKDQDLDFVFGNLNFDNNILIISYFQIDPILKGIDYFKN